MTEHDRPLHAERASDGWLVRVPVQREDVLVGKRLVVRDRVRLQGAYRLEHEQHGTLSPTSLDQHPLQG